MPVPNAPTTSPTGGGGNDNNGNTLDLNDADVVTAPYINLKDELAKQRLLRMSNDPKVKTMLEDLRTKALDENHLEEGGAIYKKKSDGTYEERLPGVVTGLSIQFFSEFTAGESVVVHMHSQKNLGL